MALPVAQTEAPEVRAFLANATRVGELSDALTALRSTREAAGIKAFFERYEAPHRQAERTQPLRIARAEWQEKWLEVKDLLGSRMPRVVAPSQDNDVTVRKLGWVKLGKELPRAWALLRAGAPEPVVSAQKKCVRAAYRAAGWDDQYAPAPPDLPDFEFWSLPVRAAHDDRGAVELRIGELDPQTSEQQAWGHAQEVIERGVELCLPPLAEPLGLGTSLRVVGAGRPLIDTTPGACAGWVEPCWSPLFQVDATAMNIASVRGADADVDSAELETARGRLSQAARAAGPDGLALIWWWEY